MGALAAVLPLVVPHIPGWIRAIEEAFKGKDKSGSDKFATLEQMLIVFLQNFIAAGVKLPDGSTLPKDTPIKDAELRGFLEAIFQQVKGSGQLTAPVVGNSLALIQGQFTVTPLNVK